MAVPERTCVGCRARAPKPELIRLVDVGGAVVPDPDATAPGRGAYLHRDERCLRLAERRKALPRALRAAVSTAGLATQPPWRAASPGLTGEST